MSKSGHDARVDIGIDMASDQACITRAKSVAQMATTTPEYSKDPAYKGSIDAVVVAGSELDASIGELSDAEALAGKARGVRDGKRRAFRKANAAAVTQVERYSVKPEDITDRGYVALDPAQGLIPPTGILATHDPGQGTLEIHVGYPKERRAHRCVIAISGEPGGIGAYQELDGYGRRRSLPGYAPGTYYIRACTLRATKRSAWVGPVVVVVK
jgi:hypothetical protein